MSPDFRPRGTVVQTSPHFLSHNAIAGFTSQSLGLPAYACKDGQFYCNKISCQNAPKLAILSSKIGEKKILGRGHSHLSRPLPRWGGDTSSSYPTPSALRRIVPRARHDSSPTFKTLDHTPLQSRSKFVSTVIHELLQSWEFSMNNQ